MILYLSLKGGGDNNDTCCEFRNYLAPAYVITLTNKKRVKGDSDLQDSKISPTSPQGFFLLARGRHLAPLFWGKIHTDLHQR